MRTFMKIALATVLVLAWSGAALALEFSAQVIRQQGGVEAVAQVHVKDGRLRLEPQGPAQAGAEGAYYIYRQDLGVSWLVYPQHNIYYEAPMQAGLDLTRPPRAGERLPGEVARQDLGRETVEGRPARKLQITVQHQGQTMTFWYWQADDLGLPIKTSAVDGSWGVVYRQIKMGPQPDQLFLPPPGFTKQDYPAQATPGGR